LTDALSATCEDQDETRAASGRWHAILSRISEEPTVPRHQLILIGIVAIVAAVAGVLLSRGLMTDAPLPQEAMTAGTLIQPPRPLPDIALVDQEAKAFDASRLKDRWTLLFFGFTNCPDVCPATLGVLGQIDKQLQDLPDGSKPQVVLVSVDPQRDTPAQLKSYVKFFSPAFVGVTGSQENLDALTRAMSVPVAIQQLGNGAYTVDHSAAIFLIDPQGSMRALFSTPHDPAKIAQDYRRIVSS
jgi:protein SCO1/2